MARNGVIAPDYKPQFLEARKAKGLTQKDVSEKLGHSDPSTYRDYEKGRVMPNGETLCKLADLFDVSTDYLLGRCPNYKTMGNAFIGEQTGLKDLTIEHLRKNVVGHGRKPDIMNAIIDDLDFWFILDSVEIMANISKNCESLKPSDDHLYIDDSAVMLESGDAFWYFAERAARLLRNQVVSIAEKLYSIRGTSNGND